MRDLILLLTLICFVHCLSFSFVPCSLGQCFLHLLRCPLSQQWPRKSWPVTVKMTAKCSDSRLGKFASRITCTGHTSFCSLHSTMNLCKDCAGSFQNKALTANLVQFFYLTPIIMQITGLKLWANKTKPQLHFGYLLSSTIQSFCWIKDIFIKYLSV